MGSGQQLQASVTVKGLLGLGTCFLFLEIKPFVPGGNFSLRALLTKRMSSLAALLLLLSAPPHVWEQKQACGTREKAGIRTQKDQDGICRKFLMSPRPRDHREQTKHPGGWEVPARSQKLCQPRDGTIGLSQAEAAPISAHATSPAQASLLLAI